jgi:hypothetical protein
MGPCLCAEENEGRHSRFQQVPFDPRDPHNHHLNHQIYRNGPANGPHFHTAQFQQFANETPLRYDYQQQPGSPYGSKRMTGEQTRISGQFHDALIISPGGTSNFQNGGQNSSLRREPSQTPGARPIQSYGPSNVNSAYAPIDMDKTVVYRQGTDNKAAILKTPRGNTPRGSQTGRSTGNRTPRSGGGNNNYNRGGGNVHNDPYYDDNNADDDEDEMILICADCYCDVMAEDCPPKCSVTGKMHV